MKVKFRLVNLWRRIVPTCSHSKFIMLWHQIKSVRWWNSASLQIQLSSLGRCGVWVINTAVCHHWPLDTSNQPLPPPFAEGRPCRQMTAQTGNVWLGYTEQTLAATWWLDMAYICSSHQRRRGPQALCSRLSVLHLALHLCCLFFPLILKTIYLPWLWPWNSNFCS